MPDWSETAPPVFQQLSPVAKTYTPGAADDDNSPAVDYIAFAVLADRGGRERSGRPDHGHPDPESGWLDERLRGG